MMATVTTESYAFDPRPNYPLFVTAKRYWKPSSPHVNDPEALTLIFTHGTGFHKEHWEPTIDDLYSLIGDDRPDFPKVREMWSIDAPNHGDAGILNEKTLQLDYQSVCSCSFASCFELGLIYCVKSGGRNMGEVSTPYWPASALALVSILRQDGW